MGKQRQSWTVEEKLGIVLAVLSERQSVAEVSRQHGVNENQIHRWKEQFLAAGRQGPVSYTHLDVYKRQRAHTGAVRDHAHTAAQGRASRRPWLFWLVQPGV